MTPLRPRRPAPATAPRAHAAPARAAGMAAGDMLGRGEVLAARALRASPTADPAATAVLAGEDGALDACEAAWAALGALERGQLAAARATLEALIVRQRPDGLLPTRLERRRTLADGVRRLLGRAPQARPLDQAVFAAEAGAGVMANALVAWAAGEYATRAGDPGFAARHGVALEQAVAWIDARIGQGLPGAGQEAAYHLAQLALGHLAIAQGDAVAGARRWAAAAAAKGRIQDAERDAQAPVADVLLAVCVGACDHATAADALRRAPAASPAGLAALAAVRAGHLAEAQALLEAGAEAALADDAFASPAEAGLFVRALAELRQALEADAAKASARPKRRQLQLSEDEARILSAC